MVYEMGCQPSNFGAVEIVVNGEPRQAPAGQTILGLLEELRLRRFVLFRYRSWRALVQLLPATELDL